MKYSQKEGSKKEYVSRINRVIDYVKNNLDEDLSLERLANVGLFSKFYFHRIFKSISGESLNSYVNRTRIESSAFFLIHHPKASITSIAYDSGFSSPAVYSRAFKARYDMSPSQWRKLKCIEKSKICKVSSNIGQLHSKNCKGTDKVTLYIDSRTQKPIWRIKMNNDKSLDVTVQTMSDIHVAYIRHHGQYDPHDKQLFEGLFSRLMGWAIPRKLFNPPATKAMTVYSSGHPDTTAAENLNVDVCISIDKDTVVEGEIGKRVISGGSYAVVSLTGATMEECGKAWDEVFNHWLPESGYQPGEGGYYCNHLNDPEQHPQKLHNVEMYLPVKPL
ncbi:AraC family transcriptional regulator [Marinomonas sp. PE14-40]|uniref:AraC family transcriptional regulator n=1 Tax=Marinomonas sp. PE14-40 TaxID=3060621 RepID=UPI003F66E0EE